MALAVHNFADHDFQRFISSSKAFFINTCPIWKKQQQQVKIPNRTRFAKHVPIQQNIVSWMVKMDHCLLLLPYTSLRSGLFSNNTTVNCWLNKRDEPRRLHKFWGPILWCLAAVCSALWLEVFACSHTLYSSLLLYDQLLHACATPIATVVAVASKPSYTFCAHKHIRSVPTCTHRICYIPTQLTWSLL